MPMRWSIDFNPRSREGSDDHVKIGETKVVKISIHAPVKGATPCVAWVFSRIKISIHAPVKGATLPGLDLMADHLISIHAPVKGATRSCGRRCLS